MDHTLHLLDSHEIPSVIQKASVFGGKIAQPSSTANASSLITRLDVDTCGVMFIRLMNEVQIEKKRPISIRLNYRNLSFSLDSEDYTVEGQTLIGQIPTKAKAIAIRDTERYIFPLDKKISGFVHRVENRGGNLDAEVMLIDVSRNGIGLLLPDCEKDAIVANDHIWLRSINGVSLETPIFGRIVYAFERKFKDTVDLKCGVSLENSLPEEVFLALQQQCRLVLRG